MVALWVDEFVKFEPAEFFFVEQGDDFANAMRGLCDFVGAGGAARKLLLQLFALGREGVDVGGELLVFFLLLVGGAGLVVACPLVAGLLFFFLFLYFCFF